MSSLRTRLSIPTPAESYDALFGGTPKGDIQKLSIADLQPYPNQPFHPYSVQRLQELSEDIAQNGVLCPIIVRPMPADDEHLYSYFQILAGHNRVAAAEAAGLLEVPAIVKDVGEDEAALIMVTTNLNQRDKLLPSEKAFAYKMQLEATKRQGERTDLTSRPMVGALNSTDVTSRPMVGALNSTDVTSRPMVGRLSSAELVGKANGDGERQVQRYIRLTELIPSLLQMVDDDILPFRAGVNLSYLSVDEQEITEAYLKEHKVMLSVEQSENIKKYSQELSPVTFIVLDRMFYPQKAKKSNGRKIKFSNPVLNKVLSYIPTELEGNEISDYILRAVKFYKENK
ncbi:MAG: ParB/RepB/Spo0J family partition protein [Hydrogenoanaerobacterium sp.]